MGALRATEADGGMRKLPAAVAATGVGALGATGVAVRVRRVRGISDVRSIHLSALQGIPGGCAWAAVDG
jgi:hypothetical protein